MLVKAKLLITGAPGGTQGATAAKIIEVALLQGIAVAALVRSHDERSERLADIGAEIVIGDMLNLQDVIAATSGRDAVFFCYPVQPGLLEASSIMAYAAWQAKLKIVVNLSQGSAARWSPSETGRKHWLSEHIFSAAKVPTYNLRGAVFYENIFRQFAVGINENNEIRAPFADGSGVVPLIAAADISKEALDALLNPQKYVGKTRPIVSELLSMHEIAQAVSQQLHRKIVYKQVTTDAWINEAMLREDPDNLVQIQHLSMLWEHLLISNKSGLLPLLRKLLLLKGIFVKNNKEQIDSWLKANMFLFNES